MKTFRIICLLACLVILGYHVYDLDYHDLGYKNNKNHYFNIFLMLMLSIGNLLCTYPFNGKVFWFIFN